ncbi:MarR family winged helix-turn-helix transcriptional regulator [Actinoplanes derwentensis]|uniref:DNA-binding transcriptional regulator, MarR family n=1 Tax=Actinoplanes derwentensis TaxID=113562 RepID=A0A1H2CN58_9ACTN|nr:MarR family transcriptional regulator [Actinoplanes derwentensis]GID88593.1 MarR family transcriptional regulator [Actinoplanes derwentensis]SDT71938.1 DNA-binding transcriptional regulator, MarR family [Actinoplanes derwentensis]
MDIVLTLDRLNSGLRRIMPRDELSLAAASTLARLHRRGPQRLTDLYRPEGVTQPAMTQLVTRLERDGLAIRSSDPVDGRGVVVTATDAGRFAVVRRRAIRAAALGERLQRLSEADQAAIRAALPALNRLSQEM